MVTSRCPHRVHCVPSTTVTSIWVPSTVRGPVFTTSNDPQVWQRSSFMVQILPSTKSYSMLSLCRWPFPPSIPRILTVFSQLYPHYIHKGRRVSSQAELLSDPSVDAERHCRIGRFGRRACSPKVCGFLMHGTFRA